MTLTTLIILIAGLLGCGAGLLVQKQMSDKRRTHTLARIHQKSAQTHDVPDNADQKTAALSKRGPSIATRLKKASDNQAAEGGTHALAANLMQAGLTTTPLQFWLYSCGFGAFAAACLWPTDLSRVVACLLIFTAFLGVPRFILRTLANRRQKAFLQDFADALEAMIRLLRSGMPIGEAISMVGREYTGPVGEEMNRIFVAQKMGTPMADAVRRIVPRMPLAEVQMFATAIAIQQQTGSSLAEVLGNLAGVIRARYRLKRKVQALSAEAKISAMIIGALPVVVALSLWGVNPDYIGLLFTHPTGKVLLTGAIVWMLIGILVMKQMINFKV